MQKIRIGKDIFVTWKVSPTDQSILTKEELTLILEAPSGIKRKLQKFELEDNVLTFNILGMSFKELGKYTLTLWKNRCMAGQTVVDAVDAFKLVENTNLESGSYCQCENLTIATLDLESDLEVSGGSVPGEPGFSPYINADGYWVTKDGVTDVKAQGPQGEQGPTGPTGPAGTYTQGSGINIQNDTISVDTTTIQTKLNNTKSMTVEYEDGSTETFNVYIQ